MKTQNSSSIRISFANRPADFSTVGIIQPWFARANGAGIVDASLLTDTMTYLPNDLLVKMDIASMTVSLEARSPFLDHHLMEFAASLPEKLKLRRMTTKYLAEAHPERFSAGRKPESQQDGLWGADRSLVPRHDATVFARDAAVREGVVARARSKRQGATDC